MKTILVVDDEPKIVKLLRDYLERAGFGVRVASNGKLAFSLARIEKPDLIILDLGLPQMDGLDVTRELRKVSNVPIIMLTGRSEESDKLIGLELGADDYITKPFSPKELVVRVRILFRRIENYASENQEIRLFPTSWRMLSVTPLLAGRSISNTGKQMEKPTLTYKTLVRGYLQKSYPTPLSVSTSLQTLEGWGWVLRSPGTW